MDPAEAVRAPPHLATYLVSVLRAAEPIVAECIQSTWDMQLTELTCMQHSGPPNTAPATAEDSDGVPTKVKNVVIPPEVQIDQVRQAAALCGSPALVLRW